MSTTILRIHLAESAYLAGQQYDSGGYIFRQDSPRLREAIDNTPAATLAEEFQATSDLPRVQVGKLTAQALSARELTGDLTYGQRVTSLVGDNLSIRNGRLNAAASSMAITHNGERVLDSSSALDFASGTGASVDVTDNGDGSATVSVSSSGGSDGSTGTGVSDDGTAVLASASDLNFTNSGAATVSVSDDGDGTATIDVGATDTDTRMGLSSGGTEVLAAPSGLDFTATGAATVDVTSDGDGSATATIGATDTDTLPAVSADSSTVATDVDNLNVTASGSASVSVSDDGGGTATVNVGAGLEPVPVSGTYTASGGEFILADTTGGGFTVTLPDPAIADRVGIKKFDASGNALELASDALVDGAAPPTITSDYHALELLSDGTNWARV